MHLPPAKARVRRRAFLSDTLWPSFRCAQERNSHHKMVPSPCFPWICRAEHWKLPQNYFVESLFGILASGAGRQWNILFPSGVSKSFCFGIFPRTRLLAQQPKTTSVNSDNPCIFFPPLFLLQQDTNISLQKNWAGHSIFTYIYLLSDLNEWWMRFPFRGSLLMIRWNSGGF